MLWYVWYYGSIKDSAEVEGVGVGDGRLSVMRS